MPSSIMVSGSVMVSSDIMPARYIVVSEIKVTEELMPQPHHQHQGCDAQPRKEHRQVKVRQSKPSHRQSPAAHCCR